MNMLIGLLVGVAFFIATIKAYTLGIKHGKQLINKEVPIFKMPDTINPLVYAEKLKDNKEKKEVKSAIEEYWM